MAATSDRLANVHDDAKDNYNAEPDLADLVQAGFETPEELMFKRNHGAYVKLDAKTHAVDFEAHPSLRSLLQDFSISLDEVHAVKQTTVVCALQCAGNRRALMSQRHKTVRIG